MRYDATVVGFNTELQYTVRSVPNDSSIRLVTDCPCRQTYVVRIRLVGPDGPEAEWLVHRRYSEFVATHAAVCVHTLSSERSSGGWRVTLLVLDAADRSRGIRGPSAPAAQAPAWREIRQIRARSGSQAAGVHRSERASGARRRPAFADRALHEQGLVALVDPQARCACAAPESRGAHQPRITRVYFLRLQPVARRFLACPRRQRFRRYDAHDSRRQPCRRHLRLLSRLGGGRALGRRVLGPPRVGDVTQTAHGRRSAPVRHAVRHLDAVSPLCHRAASAAGQRHSGRADAQR